MPSTQYWAGLSLPAWDSLASVCALYPLIGPTSMWPEAIQWVLPPVLCDVTPFTSVQVAWPVQVQPRSAEREQPLFTGVLKKCTNVAIDRWKTAVSSSRVLVQAPYLDSGLSKTLHDSWERLRDCHCHHMRHQSEAKEAKKVQISTGRMNLHRL